MFLKETFLGNLVEFGWVPAFLIKKLFRNFGFGNDWVLYGMECYFSNLVSHSFQDVLSRNRTAPGTPQGFEEYFFIDYFLISYKGESTILIKWPFKKNNFIFMSLKPSGRRYFGLLGSHNTC